MEQLHVNNSHNGFWCEFFKKRDQAKSIFLQSRLDTFIIIKCSVRASSPIWVACSKRSDSGERCELLPRFYFFSLLFTSHGSPLCERLEQATIWASLARTRKRAAKPRGAGVLARLASLAQIEELARGLHQVPSTGSRSAIMDPQLVRSSPLLTHPL